MATSSAMDTSNQFVKYTITITQNSQNAAANTSNVTVSVRFYRTNTGYETYGTGTVYCKINGTTYTASVTPDDRITEDGIVLFTKTLNITHNSDGTKTLTCSAWIEHEVLTSSEQSYSQTLTAIPQKSTISAENGTLGVQQTLNVTRKSTSFSHTVTYECGSYSGTICEKSTSTSLTWTPPLDFANGAPNGTTVFVSFEIKTYSGNTLIGSSSKAITCDIPDSIKPAISIAVTDPTGYSEQYGSFVQGKSKFKIIVSASGRYGSTIQSTEVKADGKRYTSAMVETSVIAGSGIIQIVATVTDSRNRTSTTTIEASVLAYDAPKISSISASRCDSDGTGAYLRIQFTSIVTALNDKNSAEYTLKYKKVSEMTYTSVTMADFGDQYIITDGAYIIAADTASSYDIILIVTDNFSSVERRTTGTSAKKLISLLSKGLGIAFGKVAEVQDLFDVNMLARFRRGITHDIPTISVDLNTLTQSGYYCCSSGVSNRPAEKDGYLEVMSCAEEEGYTYQKYICYDGDTFERVMQGGTWGSWCGKFVENGWTYEKKLNGMMEMQRSITITDLACTTAFGTWYRSQVCYNNTDYPYPVPFVTRPHLNITFFPTNSIGGIPWLLMEENSITYPRKCYIIRHSSATASGILQLHAYGCWR